MRLDALATERHYIDHLAPVWRALPADVRGVFRVPRMLRDHLRSHGIEGDTGLDVTAAILVASYGDQRRVRLMPGRPRIARMEHGIGQAYVGLDSGAYAGGRDCDDVGLFLVPNEYSASRWRARYPTAAVDVVGSPALDDIEAAAAGHSDPTVAISFHWDCTLVPEARSSFPHFKSALAALAAEYEVVGHAHPRAFEALAPHYRRAAIEPAAAFADVRARADVYVCDNSSTLYEFAATGKPVVVLNAPWYRRDVDHGGRFWEWADVGIQISSPAALLDGIAEALVDAPERVQRRAAIVDEVFGIERGKASRRAALALTDWLDGYAQRRAA